MARLQDLREPFMPLSWANKVHFIEMYRTKRHNDLNTVQEFDLSKQKTKSTKAREPKVAGDKAVKQPLKKVIAALSPEEQNLLKLLGLG